MRASFTSRRPRGAAATGVVVAALFVLLFAATDARAQTRTFDFVTDNGNGSYSILPNQASPISIYLRETLAGGAVSLLVPEDSLFIGVARLTRTTSPTAPASVTAATAAAHWTLVDNSSTPAQITAAMGAQADVGGSRAELTGAPLITDSATVHRVLIGTFTVQAGLIPLQTTTFTLSDPPGVDSTLTNTSLTVLDPQIVSRTFTVTVLPEPAGLALIALGAPLVLARRRSSAGR